MTPRQRRFVDEYLIDFDGKHAAIRAGYRRSDARNRGYRLLRMPEVAAAITAAMAEAARRAGITPERVLEELARIAFVDWRKLAAWDADDATIKPASELSPAETAAIARVSTDGGWENRVAIAVHDKERALATLSRIFGLAVVPPKPMSRA